MSRAPTPLLAWALAAIAGGWLGWMLPAGAVPVLALAAVVLLAAAVAVSVGRPRRGVAAPVLLAGTSVLVGLAALTGWQVERLQVGPLVQLAENGGTAELTAVVVAEPRPTNSGWWTLVRVDAVDRVGERQRAIWSGRGDPPLLGSTLELVASARPLDDTPFDAWLRTRHVAVRVDPVVLTVVDAPGWVLATTEWVRARVRGLATAALGPETAGLAVGLITGDVSLLPEDNQDAMRATGLSHLTAVSGSNVAIVLAGALQLARALGLRRPARRLLLVAVLAWFGLLTRLEPSVLRASVMAALVLLADARGFRSDPIHALAGATLLLVLVDPFLARSLGLLLSVAATAGLLVVAPLIARRLGRLPAALRVLVATSVGAQVAVAPVLLLATDEVPLASILANVVAVPAAAIASTLALAGACIGLALPPAGQLLLWLAGPALRVVLATADALQGRGPVLVLGVPLVTVGCATAWLVARPGSAIGRRSLQLAVVVAATSTLVSAWWLGPTVRTLTVTAIDVGQGDAILVEVPGVAVLIDAGQDERALEWLRRNRRRHLDLVVASHPHADHVGGLPAVVERLSVGAIWWRPLPEMTPAADELADVATARGIPMHEPVAGDRAAIGGLVIDVLGPPEGRPYATADSEPNEMSIVLLVSWGGHRVLLTGDVENEGQADLLEQPERLVADLLKVPHHGSATSLPEFLQAVRASVALVSVGADNDYGHPAPATLAALAAVGTTVRRTDREGTVRIEMWPVQAGVGTADDLLLAASGGGDRSRALLTVQPRISPLPFVDSARVHRPRGCRRSAPGGSRAGSRPGRVARRPRRGPGAGPRGGRARGPPRAAHPVPVR